jgi:type II secretory pathway component GspD/PulD (secretin)
VVTGTVQGSSSPVSTYGTINANLTVNITPQITADNKINMAISVNIQDFTNALSQADGNTFTKTVTTAACVKNRDILVIGGIIRNVVSESITSVPILGDIPMLGWLFKNKTKNIIKNSLLIFIAPQIITPKMLRTLDAYTDQKFAYAQHELNAMNSLSAKRDPINRTFFSDAGDPADKQLVTFAQTDPSLNRQAQMRQEKANQEIAKIRETLAQNKKGVRRKNRQKFKNPDGEEEFA